MRILPYRRLTIETSLPAEEVVRRLTDELNPPPSRFGMRPSLQGWIIGDTFEASCPETFWNYNSFRSVAKGRIIPGRMGADLDMTVTLNPVARAFIAVFLWIAGAFFVGFGIAYLRGTTFGRAAWPVMLILPFGYLLCLATFRADATQVTQHLRRVLNASAR